MVQRFFDDITTPILVESALDDVPCALGLTEKGPLIYTTYHMHCPRRDPYVCGYKYLLRLYMEPYEWESCPVCGYGAPFKEFAK